MSDGCIIRYNEKRTVASELPPKLGAAFFVYLLTF